MELIFPAFNKIIIKKINKTTTLKTVGGGGYERRKPKEAIVFFCTGVGNGASGLYKMPKNTVYQSKNSLIYSFLLILCVGGHFSFLPFPCVNILSIDRLITVSMLTLIKVTGRRVGRWRVLRPGGISESPCLRRTSANYNRLRLVLGTSNLRVLHSAWVSVNITTVTWNQKTIRLSAQRDCLRIMLGIQAIVKNV